MCSFFNKINVLASADYVPTEEDVLRSRVRTSGIIEESYDIGGVEFLIYDVGGQVRAAAHAAAAKPRRFQLQRLALALLPL